jgi:hypothetical protein
MSTQNIIAILVFILTVLLIAGLVYFSRKVWQVDETAEQVRVLGIYSPILTWLKYRRLPKASRMKFEVHHSKEVSPRTGHPFIVYLIDLGLILILALLFGRALLDLNPNHVLNGSEWDVFASRDIVFLNSLSQTGHFPLWNPFLNGGAPFFGDFFIHVFNPFMELPVLILGAVNGMKIALLLAFLISGIGMYFLGYHLGLNRPARLWAAAIFMLNGQFAVRFTQGHYNFLPGAAWMPFIFLSALMCFKTTRKWPVIVGAVTWALLWFSGNDYYPLYVGTALVPLVLISMVEFDSENRHYSLNLKGLARVGAMLGLGILLSGIVLLPQLELSGRFDKAVDRDLTGSQPAYRAVINFLSDDLRFADSDLLGKIPVDEETYVYIGIAPFVAMAFVPLAFRKGRRRDILALLAVVWVMFEWLNTKNSLIGLAYSKFDFLYGFRYPSRALILGTILFPFLSAYGLDEIIHRLQGLKGEISLVFVDPKQSPTSKTDPSMPIVGRLSLSLLSLGIVFVLALASVWNEYRANVSMVATTPRFTIPNDVTSWLKQYDNSTYYLNAPLPNGWHQDIFTQGFYWMNAWDGWSMRRTPQEDWNLSIPNFTLNGKYLIVGMDTVPLEKDAQFIQTINNYSIYYLPSSPPYGFAYHYSKMDSNAPGQMTAGEVKWLNTNEVQVTVPAEAGDEVVVLVASYPGWTVKVDGKPGSLRDTSGYLSVAAQAGMHKYQFIFSPFSDWVGLALSILAIIALLVYGTGFKPGSFRRVHSDFASTPGEQNRG